MSQGPSVAVETPAVWPMYRAMVGVGLLCGVLIVGVFQLTKPVIARNRAEALQRAIFQVLPDARSSGSFRQTAEGRFELVDGVSGRGPLVHGGYDDAGRLVGLAIEAEGMGYQDVIRVLYGYAFDRDAIIGIRVLESRETPGLGDKIETDSAFLQNFERLDVSLTGDLAAIANPIVFVKRGQKDHPWQIDGITGATISSAAIADMLGRSTADRLPRIRSRLGDFQVAE